VDVHIEDGCVRDLSLIYGIGKQTQDCGCRDLCKFLRVHNRLATMPRDKRNQNSELFFGQTHEVFGCLHFLVFNPKLGLSAAVKCNPVFRMCVNDPLSIHIPNN
jgi:hypothetical protein